MGIVSSTFSSLAIQLAWNCQRLLDPQYRCVEGKWTSEISPNRDLDNSVALQLSPWTGEAEKRSSSSSGARLASGEVRGRRAIRRQRYSKRPASFETALIANPCDKPASIKITHVVTSTPSFKPSPRPLFWDVTSSSGCSSDSGSYLDSDSEADDRLNEAFISKCEGIEDERDHFAMSADEEAALRITVGRGHFSRSKKDRFLNHLRLEKRLNGLHNSFPGSNQPGHGRYTGRRYSGDLYRITY